MQRLSTPNSRGDVTKESLIVAAIPVFGRDGFHATSTRALAEAAGVNQALIGYHFGNKDGLYLAIFEHIARQIKHRIGPVADEIEKQMGEPVGEARLAEDAERYLELLFRLTDAMVSLMAQDASAPWAQLILREQQAPTAAFGVLYDGFMGRMLDLFTKLVERIVSKNSRGNARLMVVTILGQILAIRAARAGILRHLGWTSISPEGLAALQAQIRRNVTAQLSFSE